MKRNMKEIKKEGLKELNLEQLTAVAAGGPTNAFSKLFRKIVKLFG